MRIIPFFTRSLNFYFKKNTPDLQIYDRMTLPYSRRFLSKIYYYRRKLFLGNYTLPPVFSVDDKKTVLILNKDYSIVSFLVSKIDVESKKEIVLYTTYNNNNIYNYIKNITNNNVLIRGERGELRVSPSLTGAIIFLENKESEEEAIEVGTGILSIHSPDEIIQKYM